MSRAARPTFWRAVLVITVLAHLVIAFYPFRWDPPRYVDNRLVRLEDGSLRFVHPSAARSDRPPAWLDTAIRDAAVSIDLELRTSDGEQYGPARILTLSKDPYLSNLTVGQDGSDLVVRLRRTGSTLGGTPPFTVSGVFDDARWHRCQVDVRDGWLRVGVDGEERLAVALPPDALRSWDRGYRLALGDELVGGRPWAGDIRRAVVQVRGQVVDYVEPGTLDTPQRLWSVPMRLRERGQPTARREVLVGTLHLAAFVPFGFLVAVVRGANLLTVAVMSGALSATIEIGKVLFAARHPSVVDLVLQLLGGIAGGLAARRVRWRETPAS